MSYFIAAQPSREVITRAMADEIKSPSRLKALKESGLLDSPAEMEFDRITSLVRRFLKVDVCLISLVDENRQFFKSSCGLGSPWRETRETPLTHSFCQHVVTSNTHLAVDDATSHPVVRANAAIKDLNVIGYLGVPIRSADGEVLGSLCAIESKPRDWTVEDRIALEEFGAVVEDAIALRLTANRAQNLAIENETLAREYHHRIKNVLAVSASLLRLSARECTTIDEAVEKTGQRLLALASAHDALLAGQDDVDLKTLAARLLAPYQMDGQTSFDPRGPLVPLAFKQITPICLIIHELATNSAKYGALNSGGQLSLNWSMAGANVVLVWTEASNVTDHKNDKHEGFGTRLLSVAAAQLGGTIALAISNPLTVTLTFPTVE